jgi:hypothetical protein
MNHKVPSYVIFSIILPLFPHWIKQHPVWNSHCVYPFVCENKLAFIL